ncbi:fructose-1,6-bisphosphatase II [Halolactibacillus halophilus]|uniref:Fructose-1,6-bisphosphatase n=1 Tax=Halolactibacillus halophilus TaxID=306540 RepID=A0A1I5Q6X0_9BACI|nr:class II fructose-bisphosphatase [Halolactibacillus halophilus]GEM01616.1 fructose-1,6-bisphosphatase [Halolactibacillus halophilus]SFP41626.1 fructose-1,6-bisphosphatase II [Halolactibacillus halophilus]
MIKALALEILQISEQAAIASFPFIGSGDKNGADDAATTVMRAGLNALPIDAKVVIGEGELDEAPMLQINEQLGQGGLSVDIAVDPIEGTVLTVNNQSNALTTLALAPRGTLLHAPDMYMEKLAVGPNGKEAVDINLSIETNLQNLSSALNKPLTALNVAIQNRPRHEALINRIRMCGAKVQLFDEGDVTYALATAMEQTGIDLFIGTGGAPEGVVAAVGLKCLGGKMQGKLKPVSDEQVNRCFLMGVTDLDKTLEHSDLVSSDDCIFVGTGITDSILMKGVKLAKDTVYQTESLLLSSQDQHSRLIKASYLKSAVTSLSLTS